MACLAWMMVLAACNDSDLSDDGDSGSGAGSGGSAAIGGVGGSSGAGGASGSGGTGDGGTIGGGGGAGGVPAELNECETDEDCRLAGDCCSCASIPKRASVPMCDAACAEDRCTQLGVSAVCSQGRCVFDATCDGSRATCRRTPPECAPGTQAIVKDGCWGDCVDVSDCPAVQSCDACRADQACVSVGPMLPLLQCWDVAPACEGKPTCECMGNDICAPFSCSDDASSEGDLQLGCFCVTC